MKVANFNLKLNENWKFHLGEVKKFEKNDHDTCYNASKAGGALGEFDVFLNDNKWVDVRIPHDWLASQPCDKTQSPSGGYKKRGKGWYLCTFFLDDKEIESARLVFDGVLGYSTVYVNGIVAIRNFSGYNRFFCEIGDYLIPDEENTIAIEVDASVWEGWWYEGAGLYRNVYIEFRENLHFKKDGTFFRTASDDGKWKIDACIEVDGIQNSDTCVELTLYDASKNKIFTSSTCAEEKTCFNEYVENPFLWTPETPYLYKIRAELKQSSVVVDVMEANIGFRNIVWTENDGMYLNGKRYQIKGICCHHDHAGVGAAVPASLSEFRIKKIKESGANAYRCAHHAVTEDFLDICDRLGIFVMAENRNFSVSAETISQLESMVRVSRNHPSVFIYSLFNEEPLQAEKRGMRIAKKMYDVVKKLDDTRAVTAAMNGGVLTEENASDILDVAGINYFLKDYDECHSRMPGKAVLGTENCPTFATRGVYSTDLSKQIYASYGEDYPDYFAEPFEETMLHIESKKYAAGCFVWSAFDYRGEPQPLAWPSVISHWGMMDYCGFEKDIFYMLSAWYKEETFVHLMPHWNWQEGEKIRVCAFTNADTVELFVNGRSLGEKEVVSRRAEWKVDFEKGELTVMAKKDDAIVYDKVKTAGVAKKIILEDVATPNNADNLHIINAVVVDGDNIPVPGYCEEVEFSVSDGYILGVGNGDPNSHHIDSDYKINFFNGKAQAIVMSNESKLKVICKDMCNEIELNY